MKNNKTQKKNNKRPPSINRERGRFDRISRPQNRFPDNINQLFRLYNK
jgi:hypothetical protein